MEQIDKLQAIIDELRLESRKIEYSSALNRLTKRVDKLEEQLKTIVNYVKRNNN
jgi:hypothetical protein